MVSLLVKPRGVEVIYSVDRRDSIYGMSAVLALLVLVKWFELGNGCKREGRQTKGWEEELALIPVLGTRKPA